MMIKDIETASDLLRLMLNKDIIGMGYRPIQKIIRFFPSYERHKVKKIIRKLATKGLLLSFKSFKCISINPKRLLEINKAIEHGAIIPLLKNYRSS